MANGPACETHHLCNFLDIRLKPFLSFVKSAIRDDINMLKQHSTKINEWTLLVTFDVVNLFTDVPHDYNIEAITFCLEKIPQEIHPRSHQPKLYNRSSSIYLQNKFSWTIDKQCAIVIGTSAAPEIPNFVMGYLELKI